MEYLGIDLKEFKQFPWKDDIDADVYGTKDKTAIRWFGEMLDMPFDELKQDKLAKEYYREGMTQWELAYKVIRHNTP